MPKTNKPATPAPAPKATKPATKATKAAPAAPAPAVEAPAAPAPAVEAEALATKAEASKAEALTAIEAAAPAALALTPEQIAAFERIEAREPAPRGQGKGGSPYASVGTSNHGDTGRELAPAVSFDNPRARLVPTFFDTVIANPDLLEFTGIKAQWAARLAALAGRTAHSYAQTINRLQGGGALTANHPIRVNRAMFDAYRAHLGLDA